MLMGVIIFLLLICIAQCLYATYWYGKTLFSHYLIIDLKFHFFDLFALYLYFYCRKVLTGQDFKSPLKYRDIQRKSSEKTLYSYDSGSRKDDCGKGDINENY